MGEGEHFVDICIFCALHQEAAALLAEFEARCQVSFTRGFSRRMQYVYQYATIENRCREPLTVLVTWPSHHGPVQTAIDLVLVLNEFQPRFAAMTGICAGDQREVHLGDMIVASCAYLYEEGKIVSGPDGQQVHQLETTSVASTSQVLQYIQGFHEWQAPVRALKQAWLGRPLDPEEEPRCFIAPMASGMAVRSDDPFPWLRERYHRNVLGLDMEAASFYRALGTCSQTPALVVKGVSDYGDHRKNDQFHSFAARASAVYLLHFIQEYVTAETMLRSRPAVDSQGLAECAASICVLEHDALPGSPRIPERKAQVWTVPYRQNRCFVGRETLLACIATAFSSWEALTTPVVVLAGLGGIGKTQTALEYAYRSSGRYRAVFWVNATSQETLLADLLTLARTLGISVAQQAETQEHLLLVRRWLEQQQHWLLILDALPDFSLALETLPLRSTGHVLVTTQHRVSQAVARVLEVGPLTEQEALSLLFVRAGLLCWPSPVARVPDEERAAAQRLYRLFAGLPLALDQAGAYLEQTGCGMAEYEQRYRARHLPFLQRRGETAMDHPASVVATWSLTFQQVEARDPCAADLLRVCAFLAPAVIPQAIFLQGASRLGPHLANLEHDDLLFDTAVATLRQFSLIRRDSRTHTISLHRLVQVVLRALMPADQQALWAGRVVQALCAAFPQRQESVWAQCAFYLAHVSVCEELVMRYRLSFPALGPVVYRVGRFFHEHGQYQQALACYQRARQFCQAIPLAVDPDGLPQILESLGWLALGRRHFVQAEAYLDEAWTLKREIYGPAHLETAYTLHTLGRVAHAQRHFEEAERFYQQALQIKEQTLGKEHAETATTVLALGWLMFDQQQYPQASHFYQLALQIRLTVLGREHVGTAVVFHLLARLAQRQKQYPKAERLFFQALSIKKQTLCPDHPSLAITLQALARLYHEQHRLPDAEIWYREALRIREQMLGAEHLLTAETLHQLARCFQEQKQQHRARALDAQEQTHCLAVLPLLARPSSADQAAAPECQDEAEGMYRRVLAIRRQALGWDHPTVQAVIQEYAHLLRCGQREREARALFAEQQTSSQ
jgi:tetratricopeptide (TPR) repeat protein/nucleoside phosphorylase